MVAANPGNNNDEEVEEDEENVDMISVTCENAIMTKTAMKLKGGVDIVKPRDNRIPPVAPVYLFSVLLFFLGIYTIYIPIPITIK